jgi:hypothetical protein
MGKTVPLSDDNVPLLPVLLAVERYLFRGLIQQIHASEGEFVQGNAAFRLIDELLVG